MVLNRFLLLFVLLLAACGGGGDEGGTSQNAGSSGGDDTTAPTRTPFPTFEYVAPATADAFGQSESTDEPEAESTDEAVVELDPQMVERGLGRYEALECASCHGESGEGTDEGSPLNDGMSSEEDFITFMRSGGDLGSSHQFSTNRLSENGSRNLYQYLLSLQGD